MLQVHITDGLGFSGKGAEISRLEVYGAGKGRPQGVGLILHKQVGLAGWPQSNWNPPISALEISILLTEFHDYQRHQVRKMILEFLMPRRIFASLHQLYGLLVIYSDLIQ